MPVGFERSHSTDRALAAAVRPSLRGLSHRVAAVLAVPAAGWLVVVAPTARSRLAVGVFGACIAAMFSTSALVHARRWSAHVTEVLFRLDHTGIYLAIAGTATPIAVLALQGWDRTTVLVGVAYTVGAVIVAVQRPDPPGRVRLPRRVAPARGAGGGPARRDGGRDPAARRAGRGWLRAPGDRLAGSPPSPHAGHPVPQVQIDSRFHGPPHSANGGYACGRVAALTDTPVAVSLHVPPPLDTSMDGERTPDGGATLRLGDTLVAQAAPVGPVEVTVPAAVSVEQARDAQDRFVGFDEHPFPTCWVCGPRRPGGDGLQIFPGAVADPPVDALVAAVWTPHADVDDGQGHVAPEHVWAALDCPSYFGCVVGEPALLARLSAHLAAPVRVGEPHVVLGWRTETPDGRKRHGASAVLDADGRVLASARALWVTLSAEALAAILAPS